MYAFTREHIPFHVRVYLYHLQWTVEHTCLKDFLGLWVLYFFTHVLGRPSGVLSRIQYNHIGVGARRYITFSVYLV